MRDRQRKPATCLLVFLLLAFLASGVAHGQTAFYDAYDMGLKAEKESRWEEASGLFEKAASLRPAPGRRVKTYGLNFLDAYDPYFHLGRAALQLNRLDEATKYLGKSRSAGVTPDNELRALEQQLDQKRPRVGVVAPPSPVPAQAAPEPVQSPAPRLSTPVVVSETAPVSVRPSPGIVVAQDPSPPGPRLDRVIATVTHGTASSVATPPAVASPAAPPATQVPIVLIATPQPATAVPSPDASKVPIVLLIVVAVVVVVAVEIGFLMVRKKRSALLAQAPPSPPETLGDTRRQDPDSDSIYRTTPFPASNAAGRRAVTSSAGTDFGSYRLEKVIGQGGMGTTFRARRVRDDFPVVVKVPHDHLLSKPEFVSRFLLEGSLGATLHHPRIIRIFEAGEFQGCPFIAMELVEGTPLEKVLENGQRLETRHALEVTRDLALALDYAHMKGVVHRDMKPDNIMILPDGHAKVMDYGIARLMGSAGLTATGIYVGTPLYSAPESLQPSEVDTQSDLYSLGIILYRMLTGNVPFYSANPLEVLQRHASDPLPPFPPEIQIPDEVVQLIERLTAKRKEDRYKTAELFLRDLDAFLNR